MTMPDYKKTYFLYPIILIFVSISFSLPWIFWGIDLSDTGYNIYKSWIMFHNIHYAVWDSTWFSTYLCGIVAGLSNIQSVIGYRVLWVVLNCMTVLTTYLILIRFYPAKSTLIPISAALLLSIGGSEQLIPSYYNIPPLLVLLSVLLFLYALKTQKKGLGLFLSFLCGICVFMAINSRIPVLPFYIVFAFPLFIRKAIDVSKRTLFLRYLYIILGFTAGIIGLFIFLKYYSVEGDFIRDIYCLIHNRVTTRDTDMYHPSTVFSVLIIRYAKVIIPGVLLFTAVYLLAKLRQFERPWKLVFWSVFFIILGGFASYYKYGVSIGIILGTCLVSIVYLYSTKRKELPSGNKMLYIAAVLFLFFISFGSAHFGLNSLKYGAWLLVPIALIESGNLKLDSITMKSIPVVILIFTVTFFFVTRIQIPYRDEPVYNLNKAFSVSALRGIYSTPERVEILEELIIKLRTLGLESDEPMVCYFSTPMLYFITKTITPFKRPWLRAKTIDNDYIKSILNGLENDNSFPRFIIRSKASARNPEWGKDKANNIPFEFASDKGKAGILDGFFKRHQYRVVWENRMFAVLARPEMEL